MKKLSHQKEEENTYYQSIQKNFTLIDESYNANPLSVKNAIENFNSINVYNSKKYLLLGDMLELGNTPTYFIKIYQKLLTIRILIKYLLWVTNL